MCSNPMIVKKVQKGSKSEVIRFSTRAHWLQYVSDPKNYFGNQMLPCHRCLECRLKYSNDWAVRISLELKTRPLNNWFITFTYSDDNLTRNEKGLPILNYRDFQLFMKKLRKKYSDLKYLVAGEYGSKSGRPHYHALIFNLPLKDLKLTGEVNHQGDRYYFSKEIDNLWNKGMSVIGELNYKTAGYTTRYALKKLKQYDYKELGIPPEKLLISNGIGKDYFYENWEKIYENDIVYFKNDNKIMKSKPPRYYDRLMIKEGREDIVLRNQELRQFRSKNNLLNEFDSYGWDVSLRYDTKKDYLYSKLQKMKRT